MKKIGHLIYYNINILVTISRNEIYKQTNISI